MKPVLKRIALRSAISAVLLLPAIAVQAITPNDYAMPYTPANTLGGQAAGITLVSSASFDQTAMLVPPATPVYAAHTYLSGKFSDGESIDFRPQLLSWGQNNRWMLANLRRGQSPAPVQISNENSANSVCLSVPVARTQRDATTSALIYQLPGPDGACGTGIGNGQADNLVRAISLNDSSTTAPITLPLINIQVQPVYTGNGALRVLYAFDRGKLLSFNTALTSDNEIASGIGSLTFHGHTRDGIVVLTIDNNLRQIRANGTLVKRPLKTASRGFKVAQAVISGTDVFFVETALDPGARIKGRIYRVPADGSARATLLTSTRAPSALIQGLSDNRVVFSAGGGFVLVPTPRLLPVELLTIPRAGGSDPIRLLRVAAGSIAVIHVSSDKVFYTASATDIGAGSFSQTAYISADTGALLSNSRKGSAWSGAQFADAGDVRLLLAQKGQDGSTRGARLMSVNPSDLSGVRLALLGPDQQFPFGGGAGRGSIGAVQVEAGNNSGSDVFAFDLFAIRFTRLTNDAGTNDEFPVF